jgi:hypothetical protein
MISDGSDKLELERRRILATCAGTPAAESVRFVGHQMKTVEQSAVQVNALTGILLAITTATLVNVNNLTAGGRVLILLGTGLALASVLINVLIVLRIRWLTSGQSGTLPKSDILIDDLIRNSIQIRDQKTRGYHIALALLTIGLVMYGAAIFAIVLR